MYLHLNAGNASSAHSSLFHIQQSPPSFCFDSHTKKKTLHYTKHYITRKLYTPNTLYVTNLSTLKTPSLSVSVSPPASLTQLPVPQQANLMLADTFVTKACFYPFFLHQTQSKRDGNVREKAWWTLFTLSPVLDLPVHPSTREVGRGVGLAASYTRTSTDSNSTLLS